MPVRAVPNVHRLTLALLAAIALPAVAQESTAQATPPASAVKNLEQVTVTGKGQLFVAASGA